MNNNYLKDRKKRQRLEERESINEDKWNGGYLDLF